MSRRKHRKNRLLQFSEPNQQRHRRLLLESLERREMLVPAPGIFIIPSPYFCDCDCDCATSPSAQVEPDQGTGHLKAEVKEGGLGYNGVSATGASVGGVFSLPGAGGASQITARLTLDGVQGPPVYFSPGSAGGDGRYQFNIQTAAPTTVSKRSSFTLAVELLGSTPVEQTGYVNRRGNDFPEFGRGWAPSFYERLLLDPAGGGIFLSQGNGNLFWFGGTPGVSTEFEREAEDADDRYRSLTYNPTLSQYTTTDKFGSVSVFDSAGLLLKQRDRLGNETLYTHVSGRLATVTFPTGQLLTFSYTSGILSQMTNTFGPTITFGQSGGTISSFTEPDPDGAGPLGPQTTSFVYSGGLLTSLTDASSNIWTAEYYLGRVKRLISPGNSIEQFEPPLLFGVVTPGQGTITVPSPLFQAGSAQGRYIDPLNRITILKVNLDNNNLIGWLGMEAEIIDPAGHKTTFTRATLDAQLLGIAYPDPDSAGPELPYQVQLGYDSLGNVTSMTLPDSSMRSWSYDPTFSVPTYYMSESGHETMWTLDYANGNVLEEYVVIGQIDDPYNGETDDLVTTFTYTPYTPQGGDPPAGLLATVIDPLGRQTRFSYDSRANLTLVTYAFGTPQQAAVQYLYDGDDEMIAVIDEISRRTDVAYDGLDRPKSVTLPDPDGGGPLTRPVYTTEYNRLNQIIKQIDPLGRQAAFLYDVRRNRTRVDLPDHDSNGQLTMTTFAYNLADEVTGVTDPLSRTTTYAYNNRGLVSTITSPDPDGAGNPLTPSVTSFLYDGLRRPTRDTDPLTNLTEYVYANFGKNVTVTLADPDGILPLQRPVYKYFYDSAGLLTSTIDALNKTTTYAYDPLDRLTSITLPDPDAGGPLTAPVTTYQYDKASNLRFVTDPLGRITQYVYDNRDRLITLIEADPDGGGPLTSPTTTFAYNAASELTGVTDPLSRVTNYAYDAIGRLLTETSPDPDGGGPLARPVTTLAYDAASRLTKVTNPLGYFTNYGYNLLDHPTVTTQPDPDGAGPLTSPITTLVYDAAGQVLSLNDPVANTTTWVYDNLGRVTSETNQLAKVRTFKYDKVNNLTERTDRLGRKTEWVYDNLYRTTSEKWYSGATLLRTLTFSYDVASRLASASDPAATLGYTYDFLGRVTNETQTIAGLTPQLQYQSKYSAASERTELQALIGGTADFKNTYTYDNLSRLTVVQQQQTTGGNAVAQKRADLAYNAASQVARIDRYADLSGFEHVVSTHYSYDGMGRLTRLLHAETAATPPPTGWSSDALAGYQYVYDAASRFTSITSFVDTLTTFTHDNTDQLKTADHTGQTDESYAYDRNGNRTGGGYTVGTNNRLLSDGTFNYTYDDEGNRLTKTRISNNEKEEYTWDHRNRLTKVTFKNGGGAIIKTVDHTYDIFNQWIKRAVDPDGPGAAPVVNTFFSWEAGQINLEFSGPAASNLKHRYLFNPAAIDQILADETVTSLLSPGTVLYPLADHLGTPRDLATYNTTTDDTAVANHRRYDSYGKLISETNPSVTTAIGFTGVFFDISTALNYHRARWLDLATGRWISEDPIGFSGGDTNLARYSSNQPILLTDPWGLQSPEKPKHTTPNTIFRDLYNSDGPERYNLESAKQNEIHAEESGQMLQRGLAAMGQFDPAIDLLEAAGGKDVLDPKARKLTTWERTKATFWGIVGLAPCDTGIDDIGRPVGKVLSRLDEGAEIAKDARITKNSIKSATEVAEAASKVRRVWPKHHPFPVYLGGAIDQTLKKIPRKLHERFHAALDTWKNGKYARSKGAEHFKAINKQDVIKDLREFYRTAEGGAFNDYLCDFDTAVKESGY